MFCVKQESEGTEEGDVPISQARRCCVQVLEPHLYIYTQHPESTTPHRGHPALAVSQLAQSTTPGAIQRFCSLRAVALCAVRRKSSLTGCFLLKQKLLHSSPLSFRNLRALLLKTFCEPSWSPGPSPRCSCTCTIRPVCTKPTQQQQQQQQQHMHTHDIHVYKPAFHGSALGVAALGTRVSKNTSIMVWNLSLAGSCSGTLKPPKLFLFPVCSFFSSWSSFSLLPTFVFMALPATFPGSSISSFLSFFFLVFVSLFFCSSSSSPACS